MSFYYETSAIRKGLKVIENREPYRVVDFDFIKPGKGNAFTRCRLKNLVNGNTLDRTYKTGEKLLRAEMDDRDAQYLYFDGEFHVFMDTENYEQYSVSADIIGDEVQYLTEGLVVQLLLFEGRPLTIETPNFVELEVTVVGAGNKGDRAAGASKDAELITGYEIQVPLFVNEGDILKIDTRTGAYVERVKK